MEFSLKEIYKDYFKIGAAINTESASHYVTFRPEAVIPELFYKPHGVQGGSLVRARDKQVALGTRTKYTASQRNKRFSHFVTDNVEIYRSISISKEFILSVKFSPIFTTDFSPLFIFFSI